VPPSAAVVSVAGGGVEPFQGGFADVLAFGLGPRGVGDDRGSGGSPVVREESVPDFMDTDQAASFERVGELAGRIVSRPGPTRLATTSCSPVSLTKRITGTSPANGTTFSRPNTAVVRAALCNNRIYEVPASALGKWTFSRLLRPGLPKLDPQASTHVARRDNEPHIR
jgi:hypothetical protein